MTQGWPTVSYDRWGPTCDTLHAHTQLLGKLAVELAPPEAELQHAALRLTARGWETAPLPAPDGSGSLVVALDLRSHEVVVTHSGGREAGRGGGRGVPLAPDRPVADVTREVLAAVARVAGGVQINPSPQEVPWHVPLDQDHEHTRYDPVQVGDYFAAATQAALALSAFRAPYRGRSTPVNAWWGSFDLAVTMFSGRPADPPADGFITRNAADAEQVTIGWWPGDARQRRRQPTPHPLTGEVSGMEVAAGLGRQALSCIPMRGPAARRRASVAANCRRVRSGTAAPSWRCSSSSKAAPASAKRRRPAGVSSSSDDRRSSGFGSRRQWPLASIRSTSLLVPPVVIPSSFAMS
jgi:hypothetical protein